MQIYSRFSLQKKVIAATLILIIGAITLLILSVRDRTSQMGETVTLKRVIESNEDCQRPCWQNIRPGRSNSDTVDALLQNRDVDVNIISRQEGGVLSYEWQMNDQWLISLRSERRGSVVVVFSEDNVVLRVMIWVDICVSTIVSEYGEPTRVEPDRDFGTSYQLLYADEGLIFVVEGVRAIVIIRTIPDEFPNTLEGRNWSDVDEMFTGSCVDNFSSE
jgi:hypothetical protein